MKAKPVVWYEAQADRFLARGKFKENRQQVDTFFAEAVRHYPNWGGIAWRYAIFETQTGRLNDAAKRIKRAVAKNTGCDVRFFTAAARIGQDLRDRAWIEKMADRGLKLAPHFPELLFRKAVLLADSGKFDQAAECLEHAVNLQPNYIAAQALYAQVLENLGRLDQAEMVLRLMVSRDAKNFNAVLNLGNLLQNQGKIDDSIACYKRALTLQAKPFIFSNLGAALRKKHSFNEARDAYCISLIMEPANAGGAYNFANLLKETGDLDASIRQSYHAICIEPENASLHWNLSLTQLADGRLRDGFEEYEWRWRYDKFPSRQRNFKQPMWDGQSFEGKTLLVHAEQGMGDHLQFARFIPMIAALGGKTIVECHPPLMRLFKHFEGEVELIERLSKPKAFDFHIPLLSVPLVMGLDSFDLFPDTTPYLDLSDEDHFDIPEMRDGAFKVGFIWGGNPQFSGDFERSTKLDYFLPLAEMDGVQLFSLQKGDREPELQAAPETIVRLSDRIVDFCDTASIMKQMDLVITTCTSTAHLAGALGVPFWVLLSHNPDWRWLRGRDDNPWYPSARLFRQEKPGDWAGLFARVKDELRSAAGA